VREQITPSSEALFAVTAVTPPVPFSDFWSIYPRKIGKGGAEKAWKNALKRASAEEICLGAARYARAVQSWTGQERTYIKHPSTWLNQDCWQDEEMPMSRAPVPRRRSSIFTDPTTGRSIER
jgi:DNA replication protein DnaC